MASKNQAASEIRLIIRTLLAPAFGIKSSLNGVRGRGDAYEARKPAKLNGNYFKLIG